MNGLITSSRNCSGYHRSSIVGDEPVIVHSASGASSSNGPPIRFGTLEALPNQGFVGLPNAELLCLCHAAPQCTATRWLCTTTCPAGRTSSLTLAAAWSPPARSSAFVFVYEVLQVRLHHTLLLAGPYFADEHFQLLVLLLPARRCIARPHASPSKSSHASGS